MHINTDHLARGPPAFAGGTRMIARSEPARTGAQLTFRDTNGRRLQALALPTAERLWHDLGSQHLEPNQDPMSSGFWSCASEQG